jgi:hypothetical protein
MSVAERHQAEREKGCPNERLEKTLKPHEHDAAGVLSQARCLVNSHWAVGGL